MTCIHILNIVRFIAASVSKTLCMHVTLTELKRRCEDSFTFKAMAHIYLVSV